jgi:mono/diheme cytochrome c family protein
VLWQKTVLPTFTRLCSLCHLPGGTSGIDLSTYPTWASRRALINQRVLVGKPTPMPPSGAGKLTADEQAALQAWVASH